MRPHGLVFRFYSGCGEQQKFKLGGYARHSFDETEGAGLTQGGH